MERERSDRLNNKKNQKLHINMYCSMTGRPTDKLSHILDAHWYGESLPKKTMSLHSFHSLCLPVKP